MPTLHRSLFIQVPTKNVELKDSSLAPVGKELDLITILKIFMKKTNRKPRKKVIGVGGRDRLSSILTPYLLCIKLILIRYYYYSQ